jgi:hypothetical protein
MTSLPEQTSLAAELLAAANRDITTWLSRPDDPNRNAAGQTALKSLNALIRVLSDARRNLLVELNRAYDAPDEKALPDWASGNSGPGYQPLPHG